MPNDDLKFAEDGTKLLGSLAGMLDESFSTEKIAAIGMGLTVGGVVGAAAFFATIIDFMTSDHERDRKIIEALRMLQREIEELKEILTNLDRRVDELVQDVAILDNRQRLTNLLDYLDQVRGYTIELANHPNDVDVAVDVANNTAIVCDKFLRTDYDIWRWTDIVQGADGQPHIAKLRFKNMPTIGVYVMAVFLSLVARENVLEGKQAQKLDDDAGHLERHRAATELRSGFDKYKPDIHGVPTTLPENIKSRIWGEQHSSDKYANRNRICQWYFDVTNYMTGRRLRGVDSFDVPMPEAGVLCTLNPYLFGAPKSEIDMEVDAGVDTMLAMNNTIGRVAGGGPLVVIPHQGHFDTSKVYAAVFYVIDRNGDLQWYSDSSLSRPGESHVWGGPRKVGNGWGGFTKVFSGGGAAIYGIQPDGTLLWYGHDGTVDGTPRWQAGHQVGHDWNSYTTVFSGGEHVIYGISPDGDLYWYRHDGAATGEDLWTRRQRVGWGWDTFAKVVCGGDGLIYAIRPDGVMWRYNHVGYLDGTLSWKPPEKIGTGWDNFNDVIAAGDGVLYAFTRDSRILWYRYGDHPQFAIRPGEQRVVVGHSDVWDGPVEIKKDFPQFHRVFARMHGPLPPPR
jgi:hypothetical protein